MRVPPSERVRQRLKQLGKDQPRGFRDRVAKALRTSNSTVTPWFNGETVPDLDALEVILETANPPLRLSEFIAPEGEETKQLNAYEAKIIRALRLWPVSVAHALVAFLSFFADEEPTLRQTRNMHELWRSMDAQRRSQVYGYALDRAEGALPPDIAAEFFDQLSAEAKASVESSLRPKKQKTPPPPKKRAP